MFDLKLGYDVPALRRLEREFLFDRRGDGSLTITDRVEFSTPSAFESALITLGQFAIEGSRVRLSDGAAVLVVDVSVDGAPLDLIVPKEGLGWELEVTAIVKGTKNLEAAKKLADWAVTKKANELYAKTYPIVAYPGVANLPPNYPPNLEKVMVKNDVEWMAKNRDRILAEWTKRYDGKSAPKK